MELKEYILPLRKWWWLILASTLVATFSSVLATRQQAPIYRARATIMIGTAIDNPNPSGNDFWLTQQLATTYADIVQREAVRAETKAALDLTWLPEYTARVVPNTQLMELSVTDSDPRRAQAVAMELVNQLIQLSPTGTSSQDQQRQVFIDGQLDELEGKIKETQDEITKKQAELGGMFSARQIADAQTQIAGLQGKLSALQANYAALLSNTRQGALNTISIIEPAALPTTPVGPNKMATILLAVAIGFVLAAGGAYLMEYLDDTLKDPDEVQKQLGLVTLGAIPQMDGSSSGDELAMLVGGQSAATEAYRVLRTNLQFASVDRPLHTLMIASSSPSEGKSLTVSNLAVALAQAGQRVILMDTDLHRPRVHRLFGLSNNIGVTTALLEEHPVLTDLLQEADVPGLQVLTSGPLPPNAAELLGSSRMRDLLDQLADLTDILLLDTPPVTALADAAILASQVDGVLLVIDVGHTRREPGKRAVEALGRVNAHVIGALLNRIPLRGGGYGYYYYYYSGHYYGSENGGNDGSSKTGRRSRKAHNRNKRGETAH